MQVQSYLFFDGRCEEAIDFYKSTLGAKVEMLMRFKDSPEPQPPGMCPPGSEDKVMHASFRVGDTLVMASDGMAKGNPEFKGFSLSIDAPTEAEADRLFAALGRAGRCRCRSPRPSSRRASAWSRTASACPGWSSCRSKAREQSVHATRRL